VLDVDPRHGGTESMRDLKNQFGQLPDGPRVCTGGGGFHLYFSHPGPGLKNKVGLFPGVDVRADGGYVLAPGSNHKSGGTYRWKQDHKPTDIAVHPLPRWLLDKMRRDNPMSVGLGHGDRISRGQRNATLASLAGVMRSREMSQHAIEAALLAENQHRCDPPLEVSEVHKIAASIARYLSHGGGGNSTAMRGALSAPWPETPKEEAFQGLAGEIVRVIEPHSEADPVALLVQLLVAFGSAAGRGVHFRVEADRHHANLFAVLIGQTSKGRKGTSLGQARNLLQQVDEDWNGNCVQSGLSSGEGLIFAVRDAVCRPGRPSKKGTIHSNDGNIKLVDAGVQDKRLLVVEPEFAQCLKVMSREGNILSTVARQAWDSGDLRTLTKNSPTKATGAHISLIGHVTEDELRRYLSETEQANGFGNRFLWVCSRRSKLLPDGGQVPEVELVPLVHHLRSAVAFARGPREMKRSEKAKEHWHSIYERLSEGKPGLLGALCGRGEAQVTRLSMIYALLDRSGMIMRKHLEAALALWNYVEESVRYTFGDPVGDATADTILAALRVKPAGLSRTDISNLFARHLNAAEITRALDQLQKLGHAFVSVSKNAGRHEVRWFASGGVAKDAKKACQ
jgi:Bifunctional DNA primase/polymerase, N-terminal/Primase C terminal 1 (PriCT-1)